MSDEYIQLQQFTMTPLPGAGDVIAPDPSEALPEGAEDCGSWQPISVVPLPTGGRMSLMVVWARAVIAKKESAQEVPTVGRVIVPSAAERAKLG